MVGDKYAKRMGINLPEIVFHQFSTYCLINQAIALGFLNLRLRLNEGLLNYAGHIGYSIRPSARGKGLAKEQLRQGLQVAKSKNIKRVLVTCDGDNEAQSSSDSG